MPSDTVHTSTDGPGEGTAGRPLLSIALGVLAVVVILYSLLIVQQPLLGIVAAGLIALPYALLRFARRFGRAYRRRTEAIESVAASLEEIADRESREHDERDGETATGVGDREGRTDSA